MTYFNILISVVISYAFAQFDENKILFLDLNNNPQEIEVAKRAAQNTGKKLIVYPQRQNQSKNPEIEQLFKEHSFSSVVISGHNGGSSYSGHHGELEITDLIQIIQKSSSANKIQSLYLLGCNSANKSKIFFWKESLPELKFIAGYDGTAPFGHNKKGLQYFEDALMKEAKITSTNEFEEFKNLITNLKSVNNFPSSVFASCNLNNEEYLFLPERAPMERFSQFNISECILKVSEFKEKYLEKITLFWSGELEPTKLNPSSGLLKDAYVFLRQNEHCLTNDEGLYGSYNGDNLLFLRFNKSFNENFLEYYKEEFKIYLKELDEIINGPEEYAKKVLEEQKKSHKELSDILKNPQKYKKTIDEVMKKITQEEKDFLAADPAFANCIENPNADCSRFGNRLIKFESMKIRSQALKDYESFISSRLNSTEELGTKSLILQTSRSEEIKLLRSLVAKAVSEPEKMTRKELLMISHLNHQVPANSFSGKASRINLYMYGYDSLDGEIYPFSWHERLPGRKVDPPKSEAYKVEAYFESRFPKELKVLAKILDESV